MLTLEVANKKLITAGDFSCRINIKNPAWKFDGIPGPLAADISLPAEDNAGYLNHPNRVTKRGSQNDRHYTNAGLKHNGVPLIKGDFVVTSAISNIDGWIQCHLGKLGEEMREKSLRELSILANQTFTNKTTFDPDTDFWCTIKLMNRGFWKDKGKMSETNPDTEELTEKFESEAGFFVNQDGTGGVKTSAGTDGVAVVSPFPFLHWLIDRILRGNQLYVSDNFLKSDTGLKTLCLYHNWNILKDTPTTEAASTSLFHFFWNYYEQLDYDKISSSTWGLDNFNIADILPDMKLKDLMLSIQNTFNVFFWSNNDRTIQIIDRESIFSMNAFDLGKYRVTDWEPLTRKDVTLKFTWEHDDNDSAFNDEFENIDEKRERILDSVSTREDLYSILLPKANGDIRLVESENRYYEYGWFTLGEVSPAGVESDADALGWKPVSVGLQNYFFNDGDKEVEEIKSKFSTLRMSESGYPIAYQNGNSKTFSSVNEKFSPRLLFYKGNNTGGDESTTGKKIDWKGANGFLYNRWRLTAPFFANALPMKAKFRLPTNVLKHVIENMYEPFQDPECRFVIDELDAEPGANDETLAELKVYKIEDNFWEYNPGTVAGGGDGTQTSITPKFVGVNKYGKPYLIDAAGQYRTTSVFGSISSADYAATCAIDYDSTTHQLVVGGNDGYIHIYDLTANFRMNTIRVINANASISAIKILNNKIMIGRWNSEFIYVLDVEANIDNYTDYSAAGPSLPSGYTAHDFIYADGYYYCCTKAGEIFRSTSPTSGWTEIMDRNAWFTRMAVTDSRLYVFERDDRPFYALRSDPTNWIEFRMTGTDTPNIIEAAAGGEQVTTLTDLYSNGIIVLNGPADEDQIRTGIGGYGKGVVYDGSDIYVCCELIPTETGQIYKFAGSYFAYQFNLPEGMKLLLY